MADYYRILSGAIENQNLSSEADRQALYSRAKTALEAQFASMDQALVVDMIKAHQENFEAAVAKIEGEIKADVGGAAHVPQDSAPVSTPDDKESAPQSEPVAAAPPNIPTSPAPALSTPPQSQPNVAESGPVSHAEAPAVSSAGASQAVSTPSTPRPTSYVAPATRTAPRLNAEPRLLAGTARPSPAGGPLKKEKKRGAGAIIFAILFVLVAGGSAFGLWQRDLVADYSDRLGQMTGLWGTPAMQVATQEPASDAGSGTIADSEAPMANQPVAEDANSQPADSDNSGDSGETSPPMQNSALDNSRVGDSAPAENLPPENIQPPQDVASNTQPEQDPATGDSNSSQSDSPPVDPVAEPTAVAPTAVAPTVEAPVEPIPPSTEVAETTAEANQQPEDPAPVVPTPIELPLRAFFLVEKSTGGADPDARFNGGSKWNFDPATKILHINSVFPLRNTELKIEILANEDANFPASHTVTYQHVSLGEVPDGPIVNFPALMTREDAGSEGKPLKGAGALVVPDKYILGLSENPENVTHNLGLLHGARWLVVPVVFENGGRRALFVIEKGPQGTRALATALEAWGQTGVVGQ